MDLGLKDRAVLVTGATGGIGAAVCRAFAAEGARVTVAYHSSADHAAALAREIDGTVVRYALEEPDTIAAAVQDVDVLVANAVRWGRRRTPGTRFEDVPTDEWQPFVAANIAPVLETVQRAVPGMRANGWGRIALVSSHVATDGHRGQDFYAAAKSALHGFARSLAWDVGPDGILVNVVSPGLTATARVLSGLPVPVRDGEIGRTPTGRLSTPEDVANAIVFLCSAANGNVTGETVTVAGGR
jgi:3-oxoacyl-[acyl-carrier protein] reductase